MGNDEHHGIAHWRAPFQISFRHQGFHRDDLVNNPSRHGFAHRLPEGASQADAATTRRHKVDADRASLEREIETKVVTSRW